MHKKIQLKDNQTNEVDDTASPPEQQTSHKSSRTTPISPSKPASDTIESTLPGTKLPKTSTQWSEANVYFQLQQQSLPSYDNIDNFTSAFQQMIYNYFATNYGTLKQQTVNNTSSNKSIKNLKKELKQLKLLGHNNQRFDDQIITTSKALRAQIKSKKLTKCDQSVDVTSQLKQRFWGTCKKIFDQTENLKPLFGVTDCHQYFLSILNNPHQTKYQIPSWAPKLQKPPTLCNTSPPTYHEISTIIHKYKSKSSPCPFDQISIIPFKKCPILRTILHKLFFQLFRFVAGRHYLRSLMNFEVRWVLSSALNFVSDGEVVREVVSAKEQDMEIYEKRKGHEQLDEQQS
ncbi:hypothetical protein HELRODRAFT_175753 [Helobdella robusta]|uniref:Uncharacterized protein n=1 Tax=Helobdella robusta TaxID=6412 RepID=T1F9M2_HELRO|nr:hypothetical protein HELRODRAFT_175753 [Helobdella robusta]ESO00352.1 hypothetical protein HELRODRAFT_175753 [Helobdella robusta]